MNCASWNVISISFSRATYSFVLDSVILGFLIESRRKLVSSLSTIA